MTAFHEFSVEGRDGSSQALTPHRDEVLLVVNVASKCGFTPQYEGLQALHSELSAQGFSVLGFPCDQFGHQEPGSNEEIQTFCSTNYQVTFPVFGKLEVNGEGAAPVYTWLKKEAKGLLGTEAIKWNFTKFLVNKDGQCVRRYAPTVKPAELRADIVALLG